MRLLWARVGMPYSPGTGLPIEAQQVSQMVDRTMALPEGTRDYLLAPVVRGRKGEYRKELADGKQGFPRVRINGEFHDIDAPPELDKKYKHDIEVVVDRIVVREGIETRLADSSSTALKLADGLAILETAPPADEAGEGEEPQRITFSEKFACPVSGFTIPEIEPRLFSFNAPHGACPACDGLGRAVLRPAAHRPQRGPAAAARRGRALGQVAVALLHARPSRRWPALRLRPADALARPARGGAAGHPLRHRGRADPLPLRRGRPGLRGQQAVRGRDRQSRPPLPRDRKRLDARGAGALPDHPPVRDLPRRPPQARAAGGQDRRPAHRRGGAAVGPRRARLVRDRARARSPAQRNEIARAILKEINERLGFLDNVGLDYLNLDRTSGTLSGGESQRIRLASQIGSGLSGVLYVLDEPSIGLHQRDNDRLLKR